MFEIVARDGSARTGVLHTKSYPVHTPAFMPVNTKGVAKFVTPRDLVEMDVEVLISNSFLLYLSPGLKKVGDLHKFMNFPRAIFTDCGAFQMLRESMYRGHTDQGIMFQDPFSKKNLMLTPRDIMKIQTHLQSDVAMSLDNLPNHTLGREDVERAVKLTLEWHRTCKEVHTGLWAGVEKKQLLFGIGQGGLHPDLRESCLKELVKMDFDGYAIGGLCIGEPKSEMGRIIDVSKKIIPEDKPVYLMGVGSPEDIVDAVGRGVDIFDSAYPTIIARHGYVFTDEGYLSIKSTKCAEDESPLSRSCGCYVCRMHTRKYVHHLIKLNEPTGFILTSYHNLWFLQRFVAQCREEITKGTFEEWKDDILRKFKKGIKKGESE